MNEYSIKNSKKKFFFYYFYDIDTSCIAAIEYVIYKYGNHIWFNAALKKVITDIYSKQRKDICSIPFTIIRRKYKTKDKEDKLKHKGYHYIIYKIKQYHNKYNKNNNNNINNIIIMMLTVIILIIILLMSMCNYNNNKNKNISNITHYHVKL